MNQAQITGNRAKIVSLLCLFVVVSILVAGLWPFHAPRNAVTWLHGQNGLRFSRRGTAVSARAFQADSPGNDTGCSLEILLKPERIAAGGTILAFDSSADPRNPFMLQQFRAGIRVQRYLTDDRGDVTLPKFKIDHLFDSGKQILLTITSNTDGATFYADGILVGISKSAIASREMSGTLVLGNSTLDDTWRGQISGLAIYRGALTPEQVRKHFQSWTSVGAPSLTGELPATALYLFDERAGDTVHNRMSTDTDLTIPAKYFVLHQAFLRSTWAQYANTWEIWTFLSFWEDIALNVFGFMPVGFVFFAYFSSVKPIARPALVTILLGLFLSFTVEALQSLLPTRDSGMTDLFTNTAGTALGVLLYQSGWLRRRTSRPLCRNIFQ